MTDKELQGAEAEEEFVPQEYKPYAGYVPGVVADLDAIAKAAMEGRLGAPAAKQEVEEAAEEAVEEAAEEAAEDEEEFVPQEYKPYAGYIPGVVADLDAIAKAAMEKMAKK